jgi:hypothetical protein
VALVRDVLFVRMDQSMPRSTPIKLAKCQKKPPGKGRKRKKETESRNNHKRGDALIDGCLLSP